MMLRGASFSFSEFVERMRTSADVFSAALSALSSAKRTKNLCVSIGKSGKWSIDSSCALSVESLTKTFSNALSGRFMVPLFISSADVCAGVYLCDAGSSSVIYASPFSESYASTAELVARKLFEPDEIPLFRSPFSREKRLLTFAVDPWEDRSAEWSNWQFKYTALTAEKTISFTPASLLVGAILIYIHVWGQDLIASGLYQPSLFRRFPRRSVEAKKKDEDKGEDKEAERDDREFYYYTNGQTFDPSSEADIVLLKIVRGDYVDLGDLDPDYPSVLRNMLLSASRKELSPSSPSKKTNLATQDLEALMNYLADIFPSKYLLAIGKVPALFMEHQNLELEPGNPGVQDLWIVRGNGKYYPDETNVYAVRSSPNLRVVPMSKKTAQAARELLGKDISSTRFVLFSVSCQRTTVPVLADTSKSVFYLPAQTTQAPMTDSSWESWTSVLAQYLADRTGSRGWKPVTFPDLCGGSTVDWNSLLSDDCALRSAYAFEWFLTRSKTETGASLTDMKQALSALRTAGSGSDNKTALDILRSNIADNRSPRS